MGFVGLVTDREPPARRASHCDGPLERHLSEAGVTLAVAEWMFGLGAEAVEIHPDGMHVKQFDMCGWLASGGSRRWPRAVRLGRRGATRAIAGASRWIFGPGEAMS